MRLFSFGKKPKVDLPGLAESPLVDPAYVVADAYKARPGMVDSWLVETSPYAYSATVFGTPGRSLAKATGTFAESALDYGSMGEQRTASMLAKAQEVLPRLRLYHSVPWLGTDADIDHVLVDGSTVWFIDSKWWRAGSYDVDANGLLTRDGQPFAGGQIRLAEAVNTWRAVLPDGLHIVPMVVVHGKATIGSDGSLDLPDDVFEGMLAGYVDVMRQPAPRNRMLLRTLWRVLSRS